MKNSRLVYLNFLKVTPISKLACILLSMFLIINLSVPKVVSEPGPFTKDDVISMINGLPSTYEGIPLIRPLLSDITTTINAASIAKDPSVHYEGENPIKVISSVLGGGADSTYIRKQFSQSMNLSTLTNIELVLYFYELLPETKLSDIRVDIRTDSNNYYYLYLGTQYWNKSPGFSRIRLGINDFLIVGTPDLGNINQINIRFSGTTGNYASLGLHSFSYNARSVPKLLFTFDDGFQDNYDHAYPILEAKGIKATEYVVNSFINDNDPRYMRASTLDSLYAAGWDIANHTSNHVTFGDGTSDPAVMAGYYNDCKNYLLGRGYTRSAAFAAYPGGKWTDALINELKSIGIVSARTTTTGLNPQPYTDVFKLRQINVAATTTFGVNNSDNDIKASIDRAISTGQTLIIRMYRVTPDGELTLPGDDTNYMKTSETLLNQIAQYVDAIGAETLTVSEWYSQIQNTVSLNFSNRADIEATRSAYDSLTPEDKLLVLNYSKLNDAEAKIAQLTADAIDIIESYAANDNADMLTINDLSDIGIIGADENNLQAYKIAITNSISTEVDTLSEIQVIIDAINESARFPIITINPYNTEPTNQYITVTATTNKGILNTTSHTFTENGSFDFIATADANHITTRTVTITNIDRTITTLESFHPYTNNFDSTWVYAANNADNVEITFSEDTFTESGLDYIYIMDENDVQISGSPFSGAELASQTKTIEDNVIKIRLATNGSGTFYGFRVTDIQTFFATLPDVPSDFTMTGTTDTTVDLTWSSAPKARSYNIYNGITKVNTDPITNTSYHITGLNQLTEYTFSVTAVNEIGETLPSSQVVITTEETPTIPAAPADLLLTAKTHTTVGLSWSVSTKATGYNLYMNGSKINDVPIVSTFYSVTDLTQLTEYTFIIKAVNAIGESLSGAALSVTTNETPKSLAVISKINDLPSTYEGIPLFKPELSEITSTINAQSPIIDESAIYQGAHPIKVTSSLIGGGLGATYVRKDFYQPQNLSSLTNIELVLNFYDPIPSEKLDDIRVDLRTDADNYYYSYLSTTYWRVYPGVARIRIKMTDFIQNGNPNLSNINSINIRFSGTDNNYASLGIYSISYNARSIPKVVLTFDDGWQDNYDHAFPILEQYGIKATTYAVSNFVQGNNTDYMRGSTLDALYAAGWDIGNHSSNHAEYGVDTSDPVVMAGYLDDCRSYLLGRGYDRSAGFVCYPDGKWDDALANEIESLGFISARTTVEGFNAQPFTDLFKLRQITVGRATTFGVDNSVNDIKAAIDRAISTGQTLYVMMHRVTPDSEVDLPGDLTNSLKTSETKLTQIAQYLASTGVATRTVSQWHSEIATTRILNLSDRVDIVAARIAYDELTVDQKLLVTNYSKLTDIEAKINQLFIDAIDTIEGYAANDNADNLTITDLTDIGVIRTIENNLQAYKLAIANANSADVDTLVEIQALVDQQNELSSFPIITIGAYDGTTPTNQDITVTATTNEGTLNFDSHTFTENGSFDFIATDSEGNITTVTVTITNIDKVGPEITIGAYDGTTPTNQDITVTATTNEGTLNFDSHIFTANGSFDFVATDLAGNTTTVTVTITNIDKVGPEITIGAYDGTTPTNQDITVTATTNEGTLNFDSHTFTENGSFDFIATDSEGNITTVTVTITNIDKVGPEITIGAYDGTTPTNQDITVTATTNEGTLNFDSHIFTANGSFNFVATDLAGNITTVTVTITNIDKVGPEITIGAYDGTTPTNQDITVTATTNEGTLNFDSHIFTANGSFDYVATDLAGNTTTVTVTITNIDKVGPEITIGAYDGTTPTNQDITVTATVNEGTLNFDSHIFTANGNFDFVATDLAGNTTTVTVTITNIDKVGPEITIGAYDGTTPTNQDITVTATTSEGTLNFDSHTFTGNGSFDFVATDAAGNITTVTVTITNIDKVGPEITIGAYEGTTPTNQDITVTATTNEGTLNFDSHIFTANGSFDFVATDAAGNITTVTVTITNIDKVGPEITIGAYDGTTPTNQDITVTATTSEGTLNFDSHAFTENGSFDFVATDAAGNSTTVTVTITNIDKMGPEITIGAYDGTTPTNQDITVTATVNEGTLNFDSHIFTANGNFDFVATDLAGNTTTVTVTITNIDKVGPEITIGAYDGTTPTNQDITVTATTNEGTLNFDNHTFTENGSYDFVATDLAGNSTTVTVTITNIDKVGPEITIGAYDGTTPTNQDITVTATTNEGTLNFDNHTFTENGSFDFVATDLAGNITTVTVTITNIDKAAPEITIGAYDGTTPTNQDITVTATVNEGTLNFDSYTFTENGSFDFVATDSEGNITTVTVTITNIDKVGPEITIGAYDGTTPTNQDITVTATVNEGTLNFDSRIFTENGSFDFVATDLAGNITTVTVTITNIDKAAPEITIGAYDGTTPTNLDITVTATTNEGTLNIDSHIFTANGSFDFVATDLAGNTTTVTVTITNIDKVGPEITIGAYDGTTPTNQDITVTATTSEGTLNFDSHTFTENGSFDFVATDAAGNITTVTVTITNIDKVGPEITIGAYDGTTPTNQDITVTATTNEGTLNFDSHIFTANGSFDFVATDAAGNITTMTVTITNIDKVGPEITIGAYDGTTPTNQDITVTATTSEGTLNFDSHTFTENGSFDFVATDAAGNITTVTVTITNIYPMLPAPEHFGYSEKTSNSIDLIWSTVPGATGYNLYIGDAKINSSPITEGGFLVTGLTQLTPYDFTVKAINEGGESINGYILSIITDVMSGDINSDGSIDILDFVLIKQHILHIIILDSTALLAADLNNDGRITISDLFGMKMSILGVQPLEYTVQVTKDDLDSDVQIYIADFSAIMQLKM